VITLGKPAGIDTEPDTDEQEVEFDFQGRGTLRVFMSLHIPNVRKNDGAQMLLFFIVFTIGVNAVAVSRHESIMGSLFVNYT